MIRLHTEVPEFLLPGQHVVFGQNFPEHVDGKMFVVEQTVQIPRRFHYVCTEDEYITVDFSDTDTEALIPKDFKTLYEILIAIEGKGFLVYPILPTNTFMLRLEEANVRPDPDDTTYFRRYLGAYQETDSPKDAPRLLAHTVKDIAALNLYLYNDAEDYAKIILHMWINRCRIASVEEGMVQAARRIQHYSEFQW